jgi:cytochrome c biogenesis protein CcmG/thiol:disulfide interchange protein DsbE
MDTNDESEVDRTIAERLATVRSDGEWQPNLQRGLALLRERRVANNGRKRRWGLITAGALVACLPIMAFPVTRAFAERWVSAFVQESAAVRQFLLGNASNSNRRAPSPSSTYVMPADRRMVPDFTLADASGLPVKLSDSRGKVVLLNFWTTICTPCKQQIPWFVEFQQTNKQRGLAVLGVSMDGDGWTSVKPYMAETRVNYPVLIGNDQVAGLFGGLHPIPLTLVIDRSGRIAAVHAGLCRKDEYEGDINTVLNEK